MSETELKILFPTEKLDALRFFIGKKDLTVEQELKDYLDKTYEKLVPAHVREYVESRLGQEPVQEETPEQEVVQTQQPEPQRERQPRQSRRQREQTVAEAVSAPEPLMSEVASDEEETQGMSMRM